MSSNELVSTVVAIVSLLVVASFLYRPAVQRSERYRALVVPLANIMDVGFIVLAPVIVVLVGFDAPFFMLGICLAAIAAGFAISYNIRHYEPLIGTEDSLHSLARWAQWALLGASVINIGYYAMLLMSLILLPFEIYSEDRVTITAALLLIAVIVIGYRRGLDGLNRLGNRTTAFNLSAIFAILVAFFVFNVQEMLGGRWDLPDYNPPTDPDALRKLLGLFAMVQGFEAARYVGSRFSAEVRVSTMRWAQGISTVVFVSLLASVLILFVQVRPEPDATAIFVVSDAVSPVLPFIILLAAIGSQMSAVVNATSSRSDLLVEATSGTLEKRYTFPILLVPAVVVVVLTDVTAAVALASRVFAGFFVLQAIIAARLSWRARSTSHVVGFTLVGLLMSTIMIFGLPV